MSLTKPICEDCYRRRYRREPPVRLVSPETEQCLFCGEPTRDGIYVRVSPAEVKS